MEEGNIKKLKNKYDYQEISSFNATSSSPYKRA